MRLKIAVLRHRMLAAYVKSNVTGAVENRMGSANTVWAESGVWSDVRGRVCINLSFAHLPL